MILFGVDSYGCLSMCMILSGFLQCSIDLHWFAWSYLIFHALMLMYGDWYWLVSVYWYWLHVCVRSRMDLSGCMLICVNVYRLMWICMDLSEWRWSTWIPIAVGNSYMSDRLMSTDIDVYRCVLLYVHTYGFIWICMDWAGYICRWLSIHINVYIYIYCTYNVLYLFVCCFGSLYLCWCVLTQLDLHIFMRICSHSYWFSLICVGLCDSLHQPMLVPTGRS